jgi:hypothetical protein
MTFFQDMTSWEALGVVLSLASIIISTYLALSLHQINRRFSQTDVIRGVNERWDHFHTLML